MKVQSPGVARVPALWAGVLLAVITLNATAGGGGAGGSKMNVLDTRLAAGKVSPPAEKSVSPCADDAPGRALVATRGTLLACQELTPGSGVAAWTVQKPGRVPVVLYTTAGPKPVLFSGIVWDGAGNNLSNPFLEQATRLAALNAPASAPPAVNAAPPPGAVSPSGMIAPTVPQPRYLPTAESAEPVSSPTPAVATSTTSGAAMDGTFTGAVPEAIKAIDALSGFKEGKGAPADTVYIIFDPRCPYCRKAYNESRMYAGKHTIKWIPTVALGDPAAGTPIAATILQSKDPKIVDRVLGKHEDVKTPPTKATEEALRDNLLYMYAAFKQNGDKQPGVPVAFFLDHRDGKARMVTGVSDPVVLRDLFGTM